MSVTLAYNCPKVKRQNGHFQIIFVIYATCHQVFFSEMSSGGIGQVWSHYIKTDIRYISCTVHIYKLLNFIKIQFHIHNSEEISAHIKIY